MIWEEFNFAKRHVPGYENAYVALTSSLLGVRETRRIIGDYMLTAGDVLGARKFSDAVYRYACYVDLHKVMRPGTPESAVAQRIPAPGTSYDVPYRCLVPKRIENLLVAGRCFSAPMKHWPPRDPCPPAWQWARPRAPRRRCAQSGESPRANWTRRPCERTSRRRAST